MKTFTDAQEGNNALRAVVCKFLRTTVYVCVYIHIHRSIYIWSQVYFFILAVDQNIFKLKLYNLRVFSSQLEEKLRNYSSLICTSSLFQGTISNWTVDSKAILWKDVGYSFLLFLLFLHQLSR